MALLKGDFEPTEAPKVSVRISFMGVKNCETPLNLSRCFCCAALAGLVDTEGARS